MFKPLLQTLVTLSGNVKLACNLSDYTKVSSKSNVDWQCFVRYARLLPLSSNLSQRNIEANLLYSTYDYDIQKFYRYYSHIFYDNCYEYDKSNYILIEKSESQKNRNTDFEFGCKRVSYLKNDTQFAFYAPIYLESINDIPDYFKISILLKNERYSLERNIRINITKEDKHNYLYVYLSKYLKQLDSNVIFCNTNSNQAVYYGIDLLKGGFNKVVDNSIAKAYTKQNTINNFDAIITNGFQRNNLVIRQIIPFCWYFNINDILTEDEQIKFSNSSAYITGYWYKDGVQQKFYNIDTNYQELYIEPYMVNINNGLFSYKDTGKNIMNMEYPSLNEAMYQGYRYSNKINLRYNRWKLKYSSDEHPYIINMSPAFSINQKSIYKYGGFPEKYSTLELITDYKNNIIIPIGQALSSKESPYINDHRLISNYLATLNNNVSTWYTLTDNLTNLYERNIWKDVNDNKVYYNGILYDFNKIYEEYPKLSNRIDKFSVILNLHFNKLSKDELKGLNKADTSIFTSDKYITDKTAWISNRLLEGFTQGTFNSLPMFYNNSSTINNGNAQLVFDKLYQKDEQGDFIDLLSLGYDVYSINQYYKLGDIIDKFNSNNTYYDDIIEKLSKCGNFDTYFKDGFEMLPIYKLRNLIHENGRDILFEANKDAQWVLDHLYFSQHGNYYKSPYDRDTIVKLIKEYGSDSKIIPVYLKSKFISKANLIDILYEIYKNDYIKCLPAIDKLPLYEYHPRIKDDSSATYACDVYLQIDTTLGNNYGNYLKNMSYDNDVLYVDRYNLYNVINNYNNRFNTNYSLEDGVEMYAKFLNMKHLIFYVSDLYKDEYSNDDIMQLVNSLYIRQRIILGNELAENISIKDAYIPVNNLYDNFRLLTNEEKCRLIDNEDIDDFNIIYKITDNTTIFSKDKYKFAHMGGGDYHDEDFYYKPEFYVRRFQSQEGTHVEYKYIKLDEYIRLNVHLSDDSLIDYISTNLMDIVLKNNIDDLTIDDISFGNGKHSSMQPLGFDVINLSDRNLLDLLKEFKDELVRIFSNIDKSIFYKSYIEEDRYIEYDNFTGINDYIILDDSEEGIQLKKAIINGEVNLITYIINDDGEWEEHDYNADEYYCLRNELDDDYVEHMKNIISEFMSDIEYHESNNYFTFSKGYTNKHDVDNILGINDLDGRTNSSFAFEVVYKKKFNKIDKKLFELINLTDDSRPYKDLYIYRIYKPDEYPSGVKLYYTNNIAKEIETNSIYYSLYPLFDDIILQDKKYSVIYSEYNQANIYEVTVGSNNSNYRYNLCDTKFMFDISSFPYDTEYKVKKANGTTITCCYTYNYYWELKNNNDPKVLGHEILPTYSLVNNCYSYISNISDDLNILDKFNVNTYTYNFIETYTYSYTENIMVSSIKNGSYYSELVEEEHIGIGTRINPITYGFILIDAFIDNTNSSMNIVDTKYKKKKYYTYINEHDIYDGNFNIIDSFNILVPFTKLNLIENLFSFNDLIIHPVRCQYSTYYKQTPLIDDAGYTYAYNINMKPNKIDNITLQRYFDNIVPFIPETNVINSSYCLKYKNYKYSTGDINYINDIFYKEDLNMYNYNKLKVYDSNDSYTYFTPIEYKHFNDNKFINLQESFEIKIKGNYLYSELIAMEKEEYVFERFKEHILSTKLNNYNNDEILFLYNRYKVNYDTKCIGLNAVKSNKLYTLTYKFTLL